MSVESSFYLVDWKHLKETYDRTKSTEFIGEALDNEEPWIRAFEFEDSRNDYLYSSWVAVIEFSDWYREVREGFPAAAEAVSELLSSMGVLTNEDEAFTPVQELIPQEHDWVFAAMSPDSTQRLFDDYQSLDLDALAKPFEKALASEPVDVFSSFGDFRDYIEGYGALLEAATNDGYGILILAS